MMYLYDVTLYVYCSLTLQMDNIILILFLGNKIVRTCPEVVGKFDLTSYSPRNLSSFVNFVCFTRGKGTC